MAIASGDIVALDRACLWRPCASIVDHEQESLFVEGDIGWKISDATLELGDDLRPPGNSMSVVPPFDIAEEDLELRLGILREATTQVLVKG